MASEQDIIDGAKQEMFRRLAAAELKRRQAKSHPSFEEGVKLLEKQEMEGANGAVGAGLSGIVDGIPIVGPYLLSGAQKAAAGIGSLIDGESYSENLKQAKTATANAAEAHPIVHTAGEVTGAVGPMIPAMAAAPAIFGAGGGPLLTRSIASALSGSAIGGADSAVRSDGDADAIRSGMMWGGGVGAAGPAVGNLVGKAAKSLIEAGRNRLAARAAGIEPEALQYVRRAVTDDALDAPMVRQRLAEMGPDAVLADLGPNLQKQAGALAATPGRSQEIVRTALTNRQAGANARIGAAVDDNFGRSMVPSDLDAGIREGQTRVGRLYGDAFREARPFNTQVITNDLDESIATLRGDAQRRLGQVRQMLNEHGTTNVSNDPQTLFQTRQAIDGMLSTEADPKVIAALSEVRQQLDDALTQSVPRIKEIDAAYAELARQREGVSRGQQVLDSGRTAPRPSELVNEIEQGALPQGMQIGPSAVPLRMTQGARAEIERIVGTNANDVVALNRLIKGEGDWNRSRLATMFGQEKADRVIKVLENERAFADTANTVTRNSETAARQAAQSELGGAGVGFGVEEAFKAGGVSGAARAMALEKGKQVAAALLPQSGPKARESLARTLINNDREAVIRALMATGGEAEVPKLVNPIVRALMMGGATTGAR